MEKPAKLANIHEQIVKDVPAFHRDHLWCWKCGIKQKLTSLGTTMAECLRKGWPKCCGQTMSLDPPKER